MHVITGGDDADMARDADHTTKEERYARTDEYVGILKRIWTEPGPTVDHTGQFYQFKGASTAIRCYQQPRIPIFFGGASDAALTASAKHADVYMLWGETHEQVQEILSRVRAEAAKFGRTLRYSLSFRPILAPTEDEAWARAERIKQQIIAARAKAGLAAREPANEGSKRLLAAAAQGERLDKRLWTGAALATGARGNTTSLVGTPLQVAEALVEYYEMGVSTFLVRGFDPLDDTVEYGRSLLPLTKQLIAERGPARVAAE
jgi:alkanesulfonate monooxygenase